jgi:hypothetical protein
MKNPTADFRKIPSYWDIVKDLPGPPVKVPNRKFSKQDAANNPGIDVAGELFVQNNNINLPIQIKTLFPINIMFLLIS